MIGGVAAVFSFVNGSLSGAASRHITFELGRGDLWRVNAVFNVSLVVFAALSLLIVLLSEAVGVWFFHGKMLIPPEWMDVAVYPQIIKSFAQGDMDGRWRLGDYPEHTLSFFHLIVAVCLVGAVKAYVLKVIHANGKMLLPNLTGGTLCCLAL